MAAEWKVRFINYPAHYASMRREVLDAVDDVLTRGDLILRRDVEEFESKIAALCGTKFALGVSNGTDALRLAIAAAGIVPGDEVITVSHTFVATAAAIHHAGATPVLVDIGDDHEMAVSKVEAAITKKTRAIIPVHVNGRMVDMERLMTVARKHSLTVIEDSAQALTASYNGKKAGSYGLAGTFSFYPAKILGAFGDAGAVVTNDQAVYDKVHVLRNHGRAPDNSVAMWSFNCRLDNFHAAILNVKLRWLDDWLRRRRDIASRYQAALGDVKQLFLPPPPSQEGPYRDVYQNYEIEAENRDGLLSHMRASGIETMVQWGGKGVHQFPALGLGQYKLPRTELMFQRTLLLPMHPDLSDTDVDYVIATVRGFYVKSR